MDEVVNKEQQVHKFGLVKVVYEIQCKKLQLPLDLQKSKYRHKIPLKIRHKHTL